jgi:serine/threonine-protein kinase
MPHESVICDFDLLRRSLDDLLSESQDEALAEHLVECDRCRQELERLAGQQNDWSRISLALKQEAESSATRQFTSADGTPNDENDEFGDDLVADFAVDFLEPSSSADAIGRLGDIDILEVIGRGGMGVVLKGYQAELKRLVAVKVLAPHLAVSGAARRRFAREAQAVAAILHPNVMPILTVNSGGRLPYLVMPFLACESLQQRITNQGPLEVVDLLRIGIQTAQGLAAAHAQGIVHRDVKPANILLERGINRVMLTDFGLARAIDDANITRSGVIAGTPQYMSPEQARGESLDARSDLFSFGSVLYTMATGRPPFRAESTYGILRRITDDIARPVREVNPQIPEWLTKIIDNLLAKSPGDRFNSTEEVAELLESCLAHVQQPTTVPLPAFCHKERSHHSRLFLGIVIAGLLASAVIVPLASSPRSNPHKHTDEIDISSDAAESTSMVTPPLQPPDDLDSAWDAPTDQLENLDRDGSQFESEVDSFWNHHPILVPKSSERQSPSTPDTEPRP